MLKQKLFWVFIILIVSITIIGCASKRYGKLALKNEQAGLYEDAADLYLKSLLANKDNITSKIGARKNGQITLDKKLSEFSKAYSNGQNKIAVYQYLNIKKYYDKFVPYGIELELPPQFEEQYNDAKKQHIEEKYKEAVSLINDEKFEESELIFKEIILLEPNYKDVKELVKKAHYEPLYRKGKTHFDNKMYRKAYYVFDEITKSVGEYKESVQYKQDALTAAQFTILIKDIEYNNESTFASKLKSSIISQLNNAKNPFIKIIESPANMDNTNKSTGSFWGRVNNVNSTNVNQNIKIPGVKAVLIAKVENIEKVPDYLKSRVVKGYSKTTKTNANGQRVDEFSKIEYNEYWQNSYAKCFFKFQLISTENATVLASDAITMETNDEVHFATYSGEYSNIVPGYWKSKSNNSPEDKISYNYSEIQNLQSMFRAKRTIKSIENLQNELLEKIAKSTSQKVNNYNPEN